MPGDITEVTRYVKKEVERTLWGRAAGRCEFSGCNAVLYRSPVTQEDVNLAEKAHIYSFSLGGPRGRGPYSQNPEGISGPENLLLVCQFCHTKIDRREERYTADLLQKWKKDHEDRVEMVTGIDPQKRSHVLLYGASIGDTGPQIAERDALEAMFPDWYPASPAPTTISMSWQGKDTEPGYWSTEVFNLKRSYERLVRPLIGETHFSVFGFAPIPLLVQLGALLTDKVPAIVYQRRREPQTWRWAPGPTPETDYLTRRPEEGTGGRPALVMGLSDRVSFDRVTTALGEDVSIWEFTLSEPHNDFLQSPDQLASYRRSLRRFIDEIGVAHGKHTPIHIFPAIPVACAIDLGRIRMPKVDAPWIIYDQNVNESLFIEALIVGGRE